MPDKKVFAINPELFSFSNTTKKKKPPVRDKIKMKPVINQNKTDTLKKKSILKMIREHQSDKNRENFSKYEQTLKPVTKSNDFEAAKNFFKQMPSKNTESQNHTIKNYSNSIEKPVINDHSINSSQVEIMNDIQPTLNNDAISINKTVMPSPKHGCLKNGLLPTYRQYMNQTRKNLDNNESSLKPSAGF